MKYFIRLIGLVIMTIMGFVLNLVMIVYAAVQIIFIILLLTFIWCAVQVILENLTT